MHESPIFNEDKFNEAKGQIKNQGMKNSVIINE